MVPVSNAFYQSIVLHKNELISILKLTVKPVKSTDGLTEKSEQSTMLF